MRPLFALVVVSFALPAHGTILQHFDTDTLVRRADLIVIGVVGAQRALKEAGPVLTESQIHVERTLHGRAEDVIRVFQLGGQIGNVAVDVPGTARLVPGTRMLLILKNHEDRFYVAGMAQGAFQVVGETLQQNVDVSLTDGVQLLPPPGARVQQLTDIEAVITRVKR